MPITLHPASTYSMQELTSIYNHARSDYLVPMQMTPDQLAEHLYRYDIALEASCVAVDDDGPCGLGMLGLRDDRAWITRLGVSLSHRRKGAGNLIVAWLVNCARSLTVQVIQLEVIHGNDAARALFESFGFVGFRDLVVLQRHAAAALPPFQDVDTDPLHDHTCAKMLEHYVAGASWVAEPRSIIQSGGLTGFTLPSGRGWLICSVTADHIEHIVVDPNADRATTYLLICHLHALFPGYVTTVENIPADSRLLPLYQSLGYTVAFRRVEMALRF